MKRSELTRRTPLKARTALQQSGPLKNTTGPKSGRGFAASHDQRRKVAGAACLNCGGSPCDAAHLVARAQGGCDSPLCVVPLCRGCHRAYDDRHLDLLPELQEHALPELRHALSHVGLIHLLERVTGTQWRPAT